MGLLRVGLLRWPGSGDEAMKALSLEARVGLLVLSATGILASFIFVLGGMSFGEGYQVFVDFNNPGTVKPGAPVQVGGIKVGSVKDIVYLGGRLDPETGRRPLVRVELEIDSEVRDTIHDDALFYVAAQSVLGEQLIAIDPGSFERPALAEGAVVKGVDPPRLDLALALGYELLDTIVQAVRENREDLQGILGNIAGILRALNQILAGNQERVDRIIAHVETASEEAAGLMTSAHSTIDGPRVQRVIDNLDRTLALVAAELEPILTDARAATSQINTTLATVGPRERADIQRTIHNAADLAERANATLGDAQEVVAHMRAGRGSVGALMMDEELYDDLQEMVRDIKHNPWKLFWRE